VKFLPFALLAVGTMLVVAGVALVLAREQFAAMLCFAGASAVDLAAFAMMIVRTEVEASLPVDDAALEGQNL
jgi:polyferredoxin